MTERLNAAREAAIEHNRKESWARLNEIISSDEVLRRKVVDVLQKLHLTYADFASFHMTRELVFNSFTEYVAIDMTFNLGHEVHIRINL